MSRCCGRMSQVLSGESRCEMGLAGLLGVLVLFFAGAGCARVETYSVDELRVDQELVAGNQGMLAGDPSAAGQAPGRPTRKRYVTKIELARLKKTKECSQEGQSAQEKGFIGDQVAEQTVPEDGSMDRLEDKSSQVSADTGETSTYTVAANDTLQSISLKFYGSAGKWKRIYEANIDQLRSPDRIYAGQVLKIPKE